MKTFLKAAALILALLPLSTFAGKDPVAWSVNRELPNPAPIGQSFSFQYTFTNQLPVQLVKPITITPNAMPASEFTTTNNCDGLLLTPGQSCTVDVTFTPTSGGDKSFYLVIGGFDDNQVPTPKLTTVVNQSTSPSDTVYGQVTTSVPANMTLGKAHSYSFTFTNGTSSSISGVSVDVTNTSGTPTYTSTCGATLAAGASCVVSGEFTPQAATPTTQTVTAVFSHSGGQTVTRATSGTVTSTSGVQVSFVVPDLLPAEMIGGPSNTKKIVVMFYNNTGSTITNTARSLSITTGGASGTLTLDTSPAADNCLLPGGGSKSLLQGQACIATGTFEGNVVGSDTQVVITGSLTYTGAAGSPASLSTSTYLVPSLDTSRTISLVNNCDFPVWWSFNGAAVGSYNCKGAPSVCPTGTTCNTASGNCQWNNPAPNTGSSYMLPATTGTNTATIPLNVGADPKIQWSGLVSASVRCDSGLDQCIVAPCENANGTTACAVGKGFVGPATQAEFTFNINTSDSYDVEVINGFHIPISITPGSHTIPDNYNCGVPGNFTAENNFGSCNWMSAVVPGNGYYAVTSGGAPCDITAPSCTTGGEVCGIAVDNVNKTTTMSCGKFLGYWTADEVCGFNPTKGGKVATAFQCYTPLTGTHYPSKSIYFDLMKCSVPTGQTSPTFNSCYLSYSGYKASEIATCCGCKDWWDVTGVNANPNTASCTPSGGTVQTNPTWNSVMETQITWLKKACPSVYVYPFDDKTSGFSCTNNLPNSSNSTNYTITFCAGNTGKPSGIDEGRASA